MDAVYWVLISSLLVWGAIFAYLLVLDGKVRQMEGRVGTEERE